MPKYPFTFLEDCTSNVRNQKTLLANLLRGAMKKANSQIQEKSNATVDPAALI